MTVRIQCDRDGCSNVFEADADAESARCPACGQQHSLDDVDGDAGGDGTGTADADVAVSGGDLAGNDLVIEIRIRLEPRGGGR
ncbi:hypothetical protein [Haloplanus natans]|uniref:hypothetical protein n=1 Tax=Haloplanus natans TaxID=376171 RepID=UPI000677D391|nr:hypothetical protein [Haloplanus natans]